MKNLSAILATLLACSAVHAAGNQVEVHGRSLHSLSTAEAVELQGRYELADGRVLEVSRQGRRLSAVLGGSERALLAISATRLQSADGQLTLNFDTSANGSVHRVTMTQAGRAPVATTPAAPRV
jgi:hypothetical protein